MARTLARKMGTWLRTQRVLASSCANHAQCPEEDKNAFQGFSRYTYFNTITFGINLQALQEVF